MSDLLNKTHRILEKGVMEFRPFGQDVKGEKIRDVSGMTVRANVEYLKEVITRTKGREAGDLALQDLTRLLNERITDPAYHVTPEFLQNPWNSYSYEFVMYLAEFCVELSGDSDFHLNLGREKFLSPIIQVLGRPFSIVQIYRLYPYFVEKFTKGALRPRVLSVTNGAAVMRLEISEKTARQFGRYRFGCVERICQNTKSAIAEVPARMFLLKSAMIEDQRCMGNGDEFCEWRFTWEPQLSSSWVWPGIGILLGGILMVYLHGSYPALSIWEDAGIAAIPAVIFWLAGTLWNDRRALQGQSKLIQEQLQFVEAQHEELRVAYLEQEQTTVELRHKIGELTMFYQIGLRLSSTLDRQYAIRSGLEALIRDLQYDRAMISLFDHTRSIAHKATLVGVSEEIAAMASALEVPIIDPESIEGTVLLKGQPVLVNDVAEIHHRLHPLTQQLLATLNTHGFIAIPLRFKDSILGAMVAYRTTSSLLTQADTNVLLTVGNQIALALHNADTYAEVQQLNLSLEAKVRERTFDLEQANRLLETTNEQLQQMNQMKTQFLSHCSHELRTPLTSIKGFSENLIEGLVGQLNEKQLKYLHRINANADRLTRMISDLLDLSRIEAGKIPINLGEVNLSKLASDVIDQYQLLAQGKGQALDGRFAKGDLWILADGDRLTQILTNLVHNAIKFTPPGGSIRITTARISENSVMMSVSDTGQGIPEEAIPKLFDPFYQAHRQQEIGTKGLGLGLAIVKNLVDLHEGAIAVECGKEQGTTFKVTLPIKPKQPPQA